MIRRAAWALLALVFPGGCRACGARLSAGEKFFCRPCVEGAARLRGPYCTVCGRQFQGAGDPHPCGDCMKKRPPFDLARAPLAYGGVIKEVIHLYKYRPVRALSAPLGGFVGEGARRWFSDAEVACAVPLHKRRLRHRGFNQSLFLARRAALALGVPLSVDGLARVRHTRPQVDLGPAEREANVRGAFEVVRPEDFNGRAVLLVDDVYTTGATVRECARALKASGANKVYVLTVARVTEEAT